MNVASYRWNCCHWKGKGFAHGWCKEAAEDKEKFALPGCCSSWRHQETMAKLPLSFPCPDIPEMLHELNFPQILASPSVLPFPPVFLWFPSRAADGGSGQSLPEPGQQRSYLCSWMLGGKDGGASPAMDVRWDRCSAAPSPHPIPASPSPPLLSPQLCSGRRCCFKFDIKRALKWLIGL